MRRGQEVHLLLFTVWVGIWIWIQIRKHTVHAKKRTQFEEHAKLLEREWEGRVTDKKNVLWNEFLRKKKAPLESESPDKSWWLWMSVSLHVEQREKMGNTLIVDSVKDNKWIKLQSSSVNLWMNGWFRVKTLVVEYYFWFLLCFSLLKLSPASRFWGIWLEKVFDSVGWFF